MSRVFGAACRTTLLAAAVAFVSCATASPPTVYREDVEVIRISRSAVLVTPTGIPDSNVGLIFYPGGGVGSEAYLPLLEDVAASGFQTIVIDMPFDLAALAPNRAASILGDDDSGRNGTDRSDRSRPGASRPGTARHLPERWVIGGHSLGGTMATRFIRRNPDSLEGLVLIASYPAANDSLADSTIPVLSIYATNDAVVPVDTIAKTRHRLPLDTQFAEITGGNHAQFGSYGEQRGDGTATISQAAQQRRTAELISAFLAARADEIGE